jgi:membrane-associated phospholipid phosphatase
VIDFVLLTALTSISNYLYELLNNVVGHSWVLDTLLTLPLENQLVKAAVIGGCFFAAWFAPTSEAEHVRKRKVLLLTLCAAIIVIGTTKTISKTVFLPRPFMQSQKAFHLEGDQLVESEKLPFRVPLDDESQKSFQALQQGNVIQNDLGSFPSDHAGFYLTLAVGIWLASRRIGSLAVAWAVFVIMGSRVIAGQHSPLDVIVGGGIGVAILLLVQLIAGKGFQKLFDPISRWTLRHQAFSSALVFIIIFEAANTLQNLRPLLKTGVAIGKHFIKG